MPAMRHQLGIALIGAVFLAQLNAPVLAQSDRYFFLSGSYVLVGKRPDSNETFTGRMILKAANGQFQVARIVASRKTDGTGKIEKAIGGDAEVLRIRFFEDGKSYEGTYLFGGDLDNYARLTGYVYLTDGSTRRAGLEALFADHGQLMRE